MPEAIGDVLDDGLFGPELGDDLRLKCRYLYLHRRIQSRQEREKDVPERWMNRLEALEDALMQIDVRPSKVLQV